MNTPRELTRAECVQLISEGGIGRVAMCTSTGPMIYPVNFHVDGHAVLFRTTAYSSLGTLVRNERVAFEADHLNWRAQEGWSVVVKGRAEVVDDPDEVDMIRERGHEPHPWAQGMRRLYIRIRWDEITGRAVGEEWIGSSTA
jgi:nitroimidazol reductase NimA-like FMN-containing flavoprotein (pyridoxamine 5'-phosphate oxidase superfamily)